MSSRGMPLPSLVESSIAKTQRRRRPCGGFESPEEGLACTPQLARAWLARPPIPQRGWAVASRSLAARSPRHCASGGDDGSPYGASGTPRPPAVGVSRVVIFFARLLRFRLTRFAMRVACGFVPS